MVAYRRLKTKENFISKSGRGRLREVAAYKIEVPNIVIFYLETFGILENWSLRREGRNRRFDCNRRGQ